MKKLLPLLLLLLTVAALLPSCQEKEPPEPPKNKVTIVSPDGSPFAIVRPDVASESVTSSMTYLRKCVRTALNYEMEVATDFVMRGEEIPTDTYEILIGLTNRPESEAARAGLQDCQFSISFPSANRIVLIGYDDLGTKKAVEYFVENYLKFNEATGTAEVTAIELEEGMNYIGTFEKPLIIYRLDSAVYNASPFNQTDFVRFYSCLQGYLNRNYKERGFIVYQNNDSTDPFWLDYIMGPGKMLDGAVIVDVKSYGDFFDTFLPYIKELGIAVWDPEVCSTSNVAVTSCSVYGYLPVCYDTAPTSLYSYLKDKGVPEKLDLVAKFYGEGTIPDTDIPSTGSTKCDAYYWAMDKLFPETNDRKLFYLLDGASCVPSNPIFQTAQSTAPNWNQAFSFDYVVYCKGFVFDLTPYDKEIPCDDPDQPLGTDRKTLDYILMKQEKRAGGEMIQMIGFPPWFMKYCEHQNHGELVATVLETLFTDVISKYNAVMEADAAHPAWMTNASVYTQYEMQNLDTPAVRPTEKMEFEENTRYFTIYLGDYDSSAWLKNSVPGFFKDNARGTLPLMWGFNPNLSDRVPMVFDYVLENLTPNDYVVAGDCGAGYVSPSKLKDIDKWVKYNEPYMSKFNMGIVGFIIDSSKMTPKVTSAYNKIAPIGSFHNDTTNRLYVNNGVPYLHMMNGIDPAGGQGTYEAMYDYMNNKIPFACFRTVCRAPSDIKTCVEGYLSYANSHDRKNSYVYVDPYTLLDLVRQSGLGKDISQ